MKQHTASADDAFGVEDAAVGEVVDCVDGDAEVSCGFVFGAVGACGLCLHGAIGLREKLLRPPRNGVSVHYVDFFRAWP